MLQLKKTAIARYPKSTVQPDIAETWAGCAIMLNGCLDFISPELVLAYISNGKQNFRAACVAAFNGDKSFRGAGSPFYVDAIKICKFL